MIFDPISELSPIPIVNILYSAFVHSTWKVNRNNFIIWLKKNNVGVSVHYPKALPSLKFYKNKYKYKKNDFFVANWIADNTISLPVGPHLQISDMKYMVEKIKEGIQKNVR